MHSGLAGLLCSQRVPLEQTEPDTESEPEVQTQLYGVSDEDVEVAQTLLDSDEPESETQLYGVYDNQDAEVAQTLLDSEPDENVGIVVWLRKTIPYVCRTYV